MKIELAAVSSEARPLAARFSPDEIGLDDEAEVLGEVELAGEVNGQDGRVRLHGTVTADVQLKCTRCLEPLKRHFAIDFEDVFVDAALERTASEAEIGEDELTESLVIDGYVDLAEVAREQLLLALPEQVFCDEACKGLCDVCGGNRNLIDCKCEIDEIDPRWAALRDLN